MFEIVNQVELQRPSATVWAVVSDLTNYRSWHPKVFFIGNAGLNAVVEYGFNGMIASQRDPSASARIMTFEPGTAIGWRFGIPALMWIDEFYRLTGNGAATRVEHGFRFFGPLAWLAKFFVARRILPMIEAADAALARKISAMPQTCPKCGGIHRPAPKRQPRRR
jgi:hypothetical protein